MDRYEEIQKNVRLSERTDKEGQITVVVHMGVCSQAAGALDVTRALEEAVFYQSIKNVVIRKTGCGGFCSWEPIVTVYGKDIRPVTYCRVTPEKARVLLSQYVLKGRIIREWTLNGKDVTL